MKRDSRRTKIESLLRWTIFISSANEPDRVGCNFLFIMWHFHNTFSVRGAHEHRLHWIMQFHAVDGVVALTDYDTSSAPMTGRIASTKSTISTKQIKYEQIRSQMASDYIFIITSRFVLRIKLASLSLLHEAWCQPRIETMKFTGNICIVLAFRIQSIFFILRQLKGVAQVVVAMKLASCLHMNETTAFIPRYPSFW